MSDFARRRGTSAATSQGLSDHTVHLLRSGVPGIRCQLSDQERCAADHQQQRHLVRHLDWPAAAFAMAQMPSRAGRWMIRATNNGVTGLINPYGQITAQIRSSNRGFSTAKWCRCTTSRRTCSQAFVAVDHPVCGADRLGPDNQPHCQDRVRRRVSQQRMRLRHAQGYYPPAREPAQR